MRWGATGCARVGAVATHPTATGYGAQAIASVSTDASAMTQLSPQSAAVAAAYQFVIESDLGKEISKVALDTLAQVTDAAGAVAADVIGDVASAVPVIGTVIAFAVAGYEYVQGALDAEREHASDVCRAELARLRPSPSGATLVPADFFAQYHNLQTFTGKDGNAYVTGEPPWIGRALRVITEDRWIVDYGQLSHLNDRIIWRARKELGQPKVGVPSARRRTFARLRVAIEAAWRPPYTSMLRDFPTRLPIAPAPVLFGSYKSGDNWWMNPTPLSPYPEPGVGMGGAEFWPLYMDLLAAEYEAGHLTREYIVWRLDEDLKAYNGTEDPCGAHEALATGILALIEQWEQKARHPNYAPDAKRLAADVEAATLAAWQIRTGAAPVPKAHQRLRLGLIKPRRAQSSLAIPTAAAALMIGAAAFARYGGRVA